MQKKKTEPPRTCSQKYVTLPFSVFFFFNAKRSHSRPKFSNYLACSFFFFFCVRKKQIASCSRGRAGSGWERGSPVRGAPKVAKRRRTKNKCKNMLNESNMISFRQLQDQPSSCAHIAHQPKRQATSRCLSTMQT